MASLGVRGCTCLVVSTLLTLYAQSRAAESRILRGFQDAAMKNRVFDAPALTESARRSKIQCVDACSTVPACISLVYNTVTKSCRLYDKDFTQDDAAHTEAHWDYFYIIRVPDWSIIKAECDRQHDFRYSHTLDFCFRLFWQEESYSDAVGRCQQFPKGNLVRIDRKLKQEIIKNYLDALSPGPSYHDQIRIAGYHSQENTWVYDDNEALTYFNWNTAQDQPDGQTGIALSRNAEYRWHDVSDDRDLKFICEIRA